MKRLVISGCPRSGTTILTRALSKHPDIYVSSELNYFSAVNAPIAFRIEDALSQGRYAHIDRKLLDYEQQIRQAIEENSQMTGDQVRELMENLALSRGAKVVGDKQPIEYTRRMASILERFDNAVGIYCLRDGRDVIASSLRRWKENNGDTTGRWWAKQTVQEAEKIWLAEMRRFNDMKSNADMSRIIILRYEDIFTDQNKVIDDMSKLLGVSISRDIFSGYSFSKLAMWTREIPDVNKQLSNAFKDTLGRMGYKV